MDLMAMADTIKTACTAVLPELRQLSEFIYNNPELGYEEFKSAAAHVDLLRSKGFAVESPYLEMATAFRAEYKSAKPGPVIAYLAEYDALPGVGHGCGHNILGAAGTGAGIVLRSLVDEIGGTAMVFGTPAEETSGAKVEMADKGAFKGVDIVIVAHPAEDNYESGRSLALEALEFTFLGKASHAGSNPDLGINALNGVIGLFNAVNAMRGHIRQESRIHGIITDGGLAANIVPEKAVARFYIRAGSKAYLAELSAMMKECAEGAARSVGAKVDIRNYEASYDDLLTNLALQKAFTRNLLAAGAASVLPPKQTYGSLDAGNVSHECPTIHPYFKISTKPVVAHTKEFAAETLSDFAVESLKTTIMAMVMTARDFIQDESFRTEVVREFKAGTRQA
jgi:amidohydrolase